MLIALLLLGCQEPFGTDRHDLEGFRVAGVRVDAEQAPAAHWLHARTATVVDGNPWTDTPVQMRWFWLEGDEEQDAAALDPQAATPVGFGPGPLLEVPEGGIGPIQLVLVAESDAGEQERAVLLLRRDRALVAAPELLALEADPPVVEAGDESLITAVFAGDATPMMRWMSIAGRGSFEEVDRPSARWLAAEVERDDGEIVSSVPISSGPATLLGLAVDGAGGNDFGAREVWVGTPDQGVFTTSARWLGTDVALDGASLVRGVLVADDGAPTGLALTGAAALAPADLPTVDPYGTDALACQLPVSGPFDPTWLLEGRCTRPQVLGAEIVVEVAP